MDLPDRKSGIAADDDNKIHRDLSQKKGLMGEER
jgi:hypothetical protein